MDVDNNKKRFFRTPPFAKRDFAMLIVHWIFDSKGIGAHELGTPASKEKSKSVVPMNQ